MIVVDVVRLLGVALELPAQAAGDEPLRGLAALLLSGLAVGSHVVLWSMVVGRVGGYLGLLALECLIAAVVLGIDGTSVPLVYQVCGLAMMCAALLGVWGAVAGAFLGATLTILLAGAAPGLSVDLQASVPVPFVLVCLLVAAVRHVLVQQHELRAALREAVAQVAAARERSRVARDLHDSVAKTVAGIGLSAGALRLAAGDGRRDTLVDDIELSSRRALNDLRNAIAGLRLSASGPFPDVLETMVFQWSRSHGVPAETRWGPGARLSSQRLGEDSAEAGLAIVVEALSNVGRHAGAAHVHVEVALLREALEVSVVDDGSGYDVPGRWDDLAHDGHFGVVGMSERSARVGGRFRVRSGPAGTAVTVVLPLTVAADDAALAERPAQ